MMKYKIEVFVCESTVYQLSLENISSRAMLLPTAHLSLSPHLTGYCTKKKGKRLKLPFRLEWYDIKTVTGV